MSRILAYTSPALGHLFPMTPLLLELRSRGHHVHVRTLAGQVERMQSLGLEASATDPRIETIENVDWRAGNARAALASVVSTFVARGEYDAPDLEQAIADQQPDLLIVDINAWGASVAAEASGLPYVVFSPYTPPIRSVGTPPFGPGFKPLPGLLGRVRDGLLRPLVMGAAEKAMGPGIAKLRAARGPGAGRERRRVLPPGAADAGGHGRAVRVPPRGLGRRHHDDRCELLGAARGGAVPGWTTSTARSCSSRRPRSSRTTASWCVRRSRHSPTSPSPSSRPCRPASPTTWSCPPTRGSSAFLPHGPLLERAAVASRTVAWARPRRRSRTAYPSAWCRSGATSSRWRCGSRSAAAAPGCRRRSSTPRRLRTAVREAMGRADGARRVADGYRATGGVSAAADTIEARFARDRGAAGSADRRGPTTGGGGRSARRPARSPRPARCGARWRVVRSPPG